MSDFSRAVAAAWSLIAQADPVLLAIVGRSLAVSGLACLLACGVGMALGAWLGVARFPGRGGVLTVMDTLLAVPSVVVGLVVYLLLSRSGPLGFLGWLFSFKAMVLASRAWRALLLAWDERYALLTVLIACFGRAVSEVGAVMIVGGNIDGFTRVMTTAIALETSKGDLSLALALGVVLLVVALALNAFIGLVRRWRLARDDVAGVVHGARGVAS
jgi:tungstate transport system permease protein